MISPVIAAPSFQQAGRGELSGQSSWSRCPCLVSVDTKKRNAEPSGGLDEATQPAPEVWNQLARRVAGQLPPRRLGG